jgi:hypothetical protein
MRGVHAHVHEDITPLARPAERPLDEAIEPEGSEALSRTAPQDDLNAARGILLGCVLGACLWLLIAVWLVYCGV